MEKHGVLSLEAIADMGVCMPKTRFDEMADLLRDEPTIEKFTNTPFYIHFKYQDVYVWFFADKGTVLLRGRLEKVREQLEKDHILLNIWYPRLIKLMTEVAPDLVRQLLSSLKFAYKAHVVFRFDVPKMYIRHKKISSCIEKGLVRMTCFKHDMVLMLLNARGITRYLNLTDGSISTSLVEKARNILDKTREKNKEYDLAKRLEKAQISD